MIRAFNMFDQLDGANQNWDDDEEQDKKCCKGPIVIDRTNRSKMWWDMFSNIFYMISYFAVPFNITFNRPREGDKWATRFDLFCDILVFVDIFLNFFTDVYSNPGEAITNKTIAYRYGTSYFIPDVLSCVPRLWRSLQGITSHGYDPWYMLKVFRLTQIPRSFQQFDNFFHFMFARLPKNILMNLIMTIQSLIMFVLFFHIVACFWVFVGR
jgi:hypothetical protein